MLDAKIDTLIAVAEHKNFTKAAGALSLTQPAVSHHISLLEEEYGATLFLRQKNGLLLTREGEVALKYARRMKAMDSKMRVEIENAKRNIHQFRVGVTHTSESNQMIEVLAKCCEENHNISMTVLTDTQKNLYDMLENFEVDVVIASGKVNHPEFRSLMLDTDYLVCAMSNNNPLAKHSMVTLNELKNQRLILRLPSSSTRMLFESTLESINESLSDFDVAIEVDNIATIKDLIRKDLGVSILARSTCMDELRKGKITVLPIESLSMLREVNIVYHKTFSHIEVLESVAKMYQETCKRIPI